MFNVFLLVEWLIGTITSLIFVLGRLKKKCKVFFPNSHCVFWLDLKMFCALFYWKH